MKLATAGSVAGFNPASVASGTAGALRIVAGVGAAKGCPSA